MDYANRKRPPRKPAKKAPGKGARRPTKAAVSVPWSLIALAVVLVVGLIWFLSSISGNADNAGASPQIQDVLPTAQQPEVEPLPEKPGDRWQYIEELENSEVQVDVPERELGPPKLMQCGSFRKESDAETLRARIAMAGLESQVRPSTGSNGVWYRVILGPYETKRDAERDRHKLQRTQVFGCQIWNWNL
ncbi:SPOR domain-containing protein [Pseudidiomarina sp.]|uniref:SPOR domain-containing protein n=1 Tax=Pseudidiomarina sp. TaxID=2081707 RepID=UPI00299E4637|nr:SPOR domain-containing protein [Pseudidiomarina sp.]MDX1706029.1 SPOR domain-containing protein [Pseudidiomarina sp.]